MGDEIKAGQVIGLSGNTGFSGGPHLHFHVCVPIDAKKFRTLPVKFRTYSSPAKVLKEDESYTAP
jgi:murein DD-endopeptidase MepM/ murein hydrolase activator NlpD